MFSSLKISNWRSHKESVITFGKGVNVILGDMGSGKSSIIDALCFALYGTFPALKSKACSLEDLPNKNISAKTFLVELVFSLEDTTFKVQRTFDGKTSKASLWVNDKFTEGMQPSRTNEALASHIKLSYDDFVSINYSSQGEIDYFIKLTPKERRLELDDFLELNKLNDLSEESKIFRNKIETINKTLSSANPLIRLKEFEEKTSKLLTSTQELESQLKQNELLLKTYSLESKNIEEKLSEATKKLKEKDENKKNLEELENKISFLKGKINDLKPVDLILLQKLEEDYSKIKISLDLQEKNALDYEKQLADYSFKLKLFNDYSQKQAEVIKRKAEILIKEVTRELDQLKNSKAAFDSELIGLKDKLQTLLKQTSGICYACEKPLTEEEKNNLQTNLDSRIKELNKLISTTNTKLSDLLQQEKLNEEKKKELIRLEQSFNLYHEKLSSLKDLKEPIKLVKDASLKETSTKLVEQITLMKKDLLLNQQISKDKQTLETLLKQSETIKSSLEKIMLTQEDVDSLRKEYYERQERRKLCESKLESTKLLLEKIIEEKTFIESQVKLEREKVEKITKLETSSITLKIFNEKINLVQENYRKKALNYLNSLMNKIWKTLYPHQNYDSILLKAEDDSYKIYLQNGSISIPVEAASGGERICVALCLRTSFALLKKSNISTLIFDEPTHNLDEKAVIQFSNTLRENYSTLIPQTIIITHDEDLKEAGTGKTILVSRPDGYSFIQEF